jgi:hypothetical protein
LELLGVPVPVVFGSGTNVSISLGSNGLGCSNDYDTQTVLVPVETKSFWRHQLELKELQWATCGAKTFSSG